MITISPESCDSAWVGYPGLGWSECILKSMVLMGQNLSPKNNDSLLKMQKCHNYSRVFFLKSTVLTWSMFVISDIVITRCSFLAVGRLFRIIFVDRLGISKKQHGHSVQWWIRSSRKTTSKPIAPQFSMAMTVGLLAQLNWKLKDPQIC